MSNDETFKSTMHHGRSKDFRLGPDRGHNTCIGLTYDGFVRLTTEQRKIGYMLSPESVKISCTFFFVDGRRGSRL